MVEQGSLGAVVLTGGSGSRLGGADKAGLALGGETLLERALAAVAEAGAVVVVGPPAPTRRPVTWAREEPPGGGPAAGLLAGVDRLPAGCALVVALAVDMPRVTAGTVRRLAAPVVADPAGTAYDGAVLVDATGHRQPLCAVYRRPALLAARPPGSGATAGMSMRRLVADLRLAEVAAEGPADAGEASDVDTWEDWRRLGGGSCGTGRRGPTLER